MTTLVEAFLTERNYRQPQRQRIVHGAKGYDVSRRVHRIAGHRNTGHGHTRMTAQERRRRSEAAKKTQARLRTRRNQIIRNRLRTFARRRALGLDRRRIAGHHHK